ncbi:putative bifunctional diguanylate cyclase/phosphodiesterase [Polymorphobacter arshaanensis]|nr:bifunctional diguanylate cyclase/phosphodiesterase [Polymorphobacter arshaanensis]
MAQNDWPPMLKANNPAILIFSPRYARELEAVTVEAGLDAAVVRTLEQALAGFATPETRSIIVDARGAFVAGLGAARELALQVEARRGALLVLLSKNDAEAESTVGRAGATHVLTSPFSNSQLVSAIGFSQLHVERLDNVASGRSVDSDASRRDPLTGLASAAHVRGWLELILAAPSDYDPRAILLIVAIGRFGQLNAAYGRNVADAVLKDVAARLQAVVSASAALETVEPRMVARLAGAEFALVLPGPVRLSDATQLAEQVNAVFEDDFIVGDNRIHLGCRIGIAVADSVAKPADSHEVVSAEATEVLFRQASAALLQARAREPGSIEVFQSAPGAERILRMAGLETDLRTALVTNQLEMVFQPQVEISSGRIVGAEALVRWQHPVLGQLSAETLLEVAESAEVAVLLGDRIRELALSVAVASNPDLHDLRMSINATAADLAAEGFVEAMVGALVQTGFPPDQLMIEVTEGDLIANLDVAAATLQRLRAHGIRIALDDFGTGYSSLAYLRALPLDFVKIDKRLVADFGGDSRDRIVVQSIIEMAHGLGMCVMAEGVENATQLEMAAAAGCDWYQGFHCAPAMSAEALAVFVKSWNADAAEQPAPRIAS